MLVSTLLYNAFPELLAILGAPGRVNSASETADGMLRLEMPCLTLAAN